MTLRKTACLLALALFVSSIQSCKSESAKSDADAQPSAQNQTSHRPDSQQTNETVVPAPSKYNEVFVGTIGDKRPIRMELERDDRNVDNLGSNLAGSYFYERAGAFSGNGSSSWALYLKGRIDGDGNVTLTETSDETGSLQKTGEFKGKLDGLSANGDVRLRFSGLWTGAKDGKQMPFSLRQIGFDLGGLKLDMLEKKSADKELRYMRYDISLPHLAGAGDARDKEFNQAVENLVSKETSKSKKTAADLREGVNGKRDFCLSSWYKIIAANEDFISVLFNFYEFANGGIETSYNESFNYDLNRNAPVNLADLFTPNSTYLKVISDYSIKELEKKTISDYGIKELRRLATADFPEKIVGPKIENFHSWNITPVGLKITFDSTQVGYNYTVFVVVPYSVLKPIIKPDGLLAQFAK